MTILHRAREEAAKIAATFDKRRVDDVGCEALDEIASTVRSMPLPEATEAEREGLARVIYSTIPNGGEVSVPSTSSSERWRREYKEDSWDEAPDRHEQCFAMADAVLAWLRSKP